MKVGIIGYGRMGKMLLEKFVLSGVVGRNDLFVSNRTPDKLRDVHETAIVLKNNREIAERSDVIFLCVRPGDLKTVLEEIRNDLKPESILISLNGSVSFDTLGKIVVHKIAKVIPSITAEINESQTLVCCNSLMDSADKEMLYTLLRVIGDVIELPEHEMGTGSELVSCMPGFIASLFDVLCNSAKKHTEIPHGEIVHMVLQTLHATSELMLRNDMSFDHVVARVATPGGITEEGVKVISEQFPRTADALFDRTLEKRRLTAEAVGKCFD